MSTQITSAQRFTIARITDLALDVSLQGRYRTKASLTDAFWISYSLHTAPSGRAFIGPEGKVFSTRLGHPEADRELGKMLTHLEALLAEGPAPATQEGQP